MATTLLTALVHSLSLSLSLLPLSLPAAQTHQLKAKALHLVTPGELCFLSLQVRSDRIQATELLKPKPQAEARAVLRFT